MQSRGAVDIDQQIKALSDEQMRLNVAQARSITLIKNLSAGCQRCHLTYDSADHSASLTGISVIDKGLHGNRQVRCAALPTTPSSKDPLLKRLRLGIRPVSRTAQLEGGAGEYCRCAHG